MKKILLTTTLLLLLLSPFRGVFAQEQETESAENIVNIYFFWGEGCPHCEEEKPFLKMLEDKYPEVRVNSYEVWGNKDNLELMTKFAKELDVDVRGVPFTVVGEQYVIGWMSDEYTGKQLEDAVKCVLSGGCKDIGNGLIAQGDINEQVMGETVEKENTDLKPLILVGIIVVLLTLPVVIISKKQNKK